MIGISTITLPISPTIDDYDGILDQSSPSVGQEGRG